MSAWHVSRLRITLHTDSRPMYPWEGVRIVSHSPGLYREHILAHLIFLIYRNPTYTWFDIISRVFLTREIFCIFTFAGARFGVIPHNFSTYLIWGTQKTYGQEVNMKKWELIAGVGALVIYVLLHDILTRVETALTIGYYFAIIWLLYGWIAGKAAAIKSTRA